MELIDYVRMLGRRWTWWVSLLVLGTLAGVLYAETAPKQYTATTEAFVGTPALGRDGQTSSALKDTRDTTLNSMPSYSVLIDSPAVLEGVLEDVPVQLTQRQLASRLSAAHLPRTVVLRISAESKSPAEAVELSTAAARRLAIAIQNLETPAPGAPSAVKVVIVRPANLPTSPTSPNVKLDIALGLLAGLGLGLLAASLRDQAVGGARRRKGRRKAVPATEAAPADAVNPEPDLMSPPGSAAHAAYVQEPAVAAAARGGGGRRGTASADANEDSTDAVAPTLDERPRAR